MIGVGDNGLMENKANALDRHLEYAQSFEAITMILLTRDIRCKKERHKNFLIIPIISSSRILQFLKGIIKCAQLIHKNRYDVVTTQDPFLTALLGVFVKMFSPAKLHIQNHSCFVNNEKWSGEKFFFPILNYVAKNITLPSADRYRVVNWQEKNIYVNDLKIDKNLIDVLPVPIESEYWVENVSEDEVISFRNRFGIGEDIILLGWAGRFVKVKNLPLLFEVVSKVYRNNSKIKLIMAGDFSHSEFNLEELEVRFGIQPIYLGFMNRNDLRLFYRSLHLYLHTSHYEGYGLTVADALCSSIPALALKTPGPSDIIENGINGYLCENSFELVSKIELLIKFPELYLEIKRNASLFASNYDTKLMSNNIVNSIINTI